MTIWDRLNMNRGRTKPPPMRVRRSGRGVWTWFCMPCLESALNERGGAVLRSTIKMDNFGGDCATHGEAMIAAERHRMSWHSLPDRCECEYRGVWGATGRLDAAQDVRRVGSASYLAHRRPA